MAKAPAKPDVIVNNGKPIAVILALKAYEALLEQAEQATDLKAIRAMKKRDWDTMSFEDYQRRKRRRASA